MRLHKLELFLLICIFYSVLDIVFLFLSMVSSIVYVYWMVLLFIGETPLFLVKLYVLFQLICMFLYGI